MADQIGIRWSHGAVALSARMSGDAPAAAEAAARIETDLVEPAGLFEADLVQRGRAWAQQYTRLVAEEEFAAWMATVKERYPVTINKAALESKER